MSECPITGAQTSNTTPSNQTWWPEQLNLRILHQDHPDADPYGDDFDYAAAFNALDLDALQADIDALMTDSQDWWPADYGHYGPFFIRMTWHAAGTYRQADGRGGGGTGAQRFAPLNSWPDNVNLDKARRLLWPIKKKYGRSISWADLLILTGNRAIATMGLEPFGFGGGREDIWAPEEDIYWGPETTWLADERYSGERDLQDPLGAVQMGLIYVNPEGPNGNPDPLASAVDIRETFGRMAMNDEETVALIAGGHTFGKTHGAAPDSHVGADPEAAGLHEQGFGWTSTHGTGMGGDTISSGLEGAWTANPIQWDNGYFDLLFKYEWELTESPAGAKQWSPVDIAEEDMPPAAHDPSQKVLPMMATTDLAMIKDPAYLEISTRFHQNPDQFADAFARAWFKLLHRDMGPKVRYLGPLVPDEDLIWQDPVPAHDGPVVGDAEIASLKSAIADSDLTVAQLVSAAWASASTFRRTDLRGGANGARVRLSPQAEWDVNVRSGVAATIATLDELRGASGTNISLADMIVLGGCVGVEQAAAAGGHDVAVPFTPGRTDATQEQTDVDAFQYLEPTTDGFRNYVQKDGPVPSEHMLLDKAFMLSLSAPEMTALVGGLRVLGANAGDNAQGVLTDRVGTLSTDFFTNLLDMGTKWEPVGEGEVSYEGRDRNTGDVRWTASRVDLVFGSNSQLRALAEVYGSNDGERQFVDDFVAAWDKVMMLDRFDLD